MAVVAGIALYIRIALPYDQVFVNGQVWFLETDSSFYMRNVQVIVQHFPHFNTFDPYMIFPGGQATLIRPLFAQLIAAVILFFRGATSLYHMEVIAAYIPPIMGALTLIPVYFIGKELFNRWVGVIAAFIVAILPTEFLHRSLLGFLDHHVAEVLFSTTAALFLIMAIRRARERGMSFDHVLKRDWSVIRKPLIYTLLAGIFLGLYLLTWQGGLYFVFIIFAYLVIQFLVDHFTHKSADYLCIIATPVFLISLLMLLPALTGGSFDILYRLAMAIAIVVPVILGVLSRFMAGRNWRPVYYPLALAALLGIGLAVLHAVNPSLFQYMFSQFGAVFRPSSARLSILEVTPVTLQLVWQYFNTSFFIGLASLAMIIYMAVKERSADKTLFLVWSVITLVIIVFGQRRFSYYYAINVSLLTGYFTWSMLDLVGLRKILGKPKEAVVGVVKQFKKKKVTERSRRSRFMQPRAAWINVIIVGIVLFFVVIFPSTGVPGGQPTAIPGGPDWLGIGLTPYVAEVPASAMIVTQDLYSSASWLQETDGGTGQPNTPDPFGDPDFYYELYPSKSEYQYPPTAYGVMSWWDYGYFIMQIGHRIPNANPTQSGAVNSGAYFTDTNVSEANQLADRLGTRYVMIDYSMTSPVGKLYAMVNWATLNPDKASLSTDDLYRSFIVPIQNNLLEVVPLFYPAYYETTAARLYNFDGKAAVPAINSTVAISLQSVTGTQLVNAGYTTIASGNRAIYVDTGASYTVVSDIKYFSNYQQAQDYVSIQTSGTWQIGGFSPFTSIVPLEATNYKLVYSSGDTTAPSTVKIFEYLGES